MFSCSAEALETQSAGGCLCHRPEIQYLTRRINAQVSRRGFMAGLATSAASPANDVLADLLLVDGDPLADIAVIANPEKNFRIIMKDGKIYKNTLRRSEKTQGG
jgi:hypothetical protein